MVTAARDTKGQVAEQNLWLLWGARGYSNQQMVEKSSPVQRGLASTNRNYSAFHKNTLLNITQIYHSKVPPQQGRESAVFSSFLLFPGLCRAAVMWV